MGPRFQDLLSRITKIGLDHHRDTILENSGRNVPFIQHTIREIQPDPRPCLVVSAGPSLYREKILPRIKGFTGCLIATDGAYIQCLKAGLRPDWVITIDPHPTRIVRWFGDPDWEENSKNDSYFERQDLDVNFRQNSAEENARNIALVDTNKTKLVICSTASESVVRRTQDFERYWFAPLVDNPVGGTSITRAIAGITKLPCLNTGGTVGTAGWVLSNTILAEKLVAVVGMDFGYYMDTPFPETQEWNMLKNEPKVHEFYPHFTGHWRENYTSPTYHWYLLNFLDLLEAADARVTNCSGNGLLQGDRVDCMEIEEWLKSAA